MKTGRSSRVFRDFFPGNLCRETRVNLFFFFCIVLLYPQTRVHIHRHAHTDTRKPNKTLYDGTYIAKNPRPGFICHFSLFFSLSPFFFFFFFFAKKNPNGLSQSNPNAFFQSSDGEEGIHLRKHPLMCQEGTPGRDRASEREREQLSETMIRVGSFRFVLSGIGEPR